MYSPSLLDDNCEVSCRLIMWFQRKHYLIFSSIQYGCQTMWPINYSLTNLYNHALGNICVKLPLDLSSHSGEENFSWFEVKSNMATEPCDLWGHMWETFRFSWRGSHTCKVSPRSVQPLQKRRILNVFFVFNNMAAESQDRWRKQKIFYSPFYA